MKKWHYISMAAFAAITLMTGCADDPHDHNEEELITTVKLRFQDTQDPLDIRDFTFRDADGPGGNAPSQFDTIVLSPGRTYTLTIQLLNESADPVEDITPEIEEEGADHQFFFNISNVNITVAYADQDVNGLPIGLENTVTTTTASSGIFQVVLKHQPGIKDGNQATGESDVELDFQARVE